jgi:3-hydroxyisobutyrate dehydrogenase-like beta-hydroxyacid dehydrogenase
MNQRVTVTGTGRMGSALAAALFSKGFATITWNRTASKTGRCPGSVCVAPSVLDAVVQAEVVMGNIMFQAWGSTSLFGESSQPWQHWFWSAGGIGERYLRAGWA